MMGIVSGSWIVSADWMAACLASGSAVPEAPHEVQKDCRGQEGGPILGRLHAVERTRLLSGFEVFALCPQSPLALLPCLLVGHPTVKRPCRHALAEESSATSLWSDAEQILLHRCSWRGHLRTGAAWWRS